MKKMNNKGFSLVELIVVIAIMAVLVGVLAPQFIKYVENSRRSTDISSAESLRSAILADIADQVAPYDQSQMTAGAISTYPTSISQIPYVKSSKAASTTTQFTAAWDVTKGQCDVYATIGDGTYCLTDTNGAYNYKNQLTSADAGKFKTESHSVGTTTPAGGGSTPDPDDEGGAVTPPEDGEETE